jgi:hypothetical protein
MPAKARVSRDFAIPAFSASDLRSTSASQPDFYVQELPPQRPGSESHAKHRSDRFFFGGLRKGQSLRTHLVIRINRILEIACCKARESCFRRHLARDRFGESQRAKAQTARFR